MDLGISYELFKKLKNDNFCFIYQGDFSDDIIVEILRLNDYNIDYVLEISKLRKRISFLMAECFQNISRHGDKPEIVHSTNNKPSMFMTRNIGSTYYISSANLIDNKKVEYLKSKLEAINTLNKDELKALHLEALTNNDLSDKGGAGLGLIEMARKSGQKLDYEFDFVNYYLSQFYVQLKLKEEEGATNNNLPISDTIEFHNIMSEHNILMVHKGDFSQESILPMLGMLENNLKQTAEVKTQKKVFYLVVELLQNISKHAKETSGRTEGIVLIAQKGKRYTISTGNHIDKIKAEILQSQLDDILNLDSEGLKQLHKKKLVDNKPGVKGGAGLGLVDVARYSTEKLKYNFKLVDELSSFYSLSITI